MSSNHLFYEKEVVRDDEQKYINNLLSKYKNEPASDELKEKIWNELMYEKHLGNITIPFKIAMNRDPDGLYPDAIEIILDTRI